jgi:hypothetical protein
MGHRNFYIRMKRSWATGLTDHKAVIHSDRLHVAVAENYQIEYLDWDRREGELRPTLTPGNRRE